MTEPIIEIHSDDCQIAEDQEDYPGFIYGAPALVFAAEGDQMEFDMTLIKPAMKPFFVPLMRVTGRTWVRPYSEARLKIYVENPCS